MGSSGEPGALPTPAAMQVLTRRILEDSLDAYADRFVRTWKVLRGGSFPEDEANDPQRARVTWERGLNAPGRARQLAAIFGSGSRREGLGRIRAPALVIHGREDPLVPVDHGMAHASLIPGARLLRERTRETSRPLKSLVFVSRLDLRHCSNAAGGT